MDTDTLVYVVPFGWHYHVKPCLKIDDNYYEAVSQIYAIEHDYKPCECVEKATNERV